MGRKAGIGLKIFVLSTSLLMLMTLSVMVIYIKINNAISDVATQGKSLESLQVSNLVATRLGQYHYWFADLIATGDVNSRIRMLEVKDLLLEDLESFKDADAVFVQRIGDNIEKLHQVKMSAVEDYEAGRREKGHQGLNKARSLQVGIEKSLQSMNGGVGKSQVKAITQEIINEVILMKHVAIVSLLAAIVLGLVMSMTIQRSVTRPLVASMRKLSSISKAYLSVSRDLNRSSHELARSSAEQSSAIHDSVTAMTELKGMVRQTAMLAAGTHKSAEGVSGKTMEGLKVMKKMVGYLQQMGDATDTIKISTESMAQNANEQIQSIAGIIVEVEKKVSVINDIVLKTQLLSFNASIEAARAGQHGKGFSVVAQEVGNLARLTGKAAQSINTLIENSKSDVNNIMQALQNQVGITQEKVVNGKRVTEMVSEVGRDAHEIFEGIAADVRDILTKVTAVNTATFEQSKGLDQIAVAMEDIQATTGKTNQAATDHKQVSQHLFAETKKLDAVGQRMSTMIFGTWELGFLSFMQDGISLRGNGAGGGSPADDFTAPIAGTAEAPMDLQDLNPEVLMTLLKKLERQNTKPGGDPAAEDKNTDDWSRSA